MGVGRGQRRCSRSAILSSGLQAAHYLHEEAARYPRKIHYHNPPDLAMEALEVKPAPCSLLPPAGWLSDRMLK